MFGPPFAISRSVRCFAAISMLRQVGRYAQVSLRDRSAVTQVSLRGLTLTAGAHETMKNATFRAPIAP